MDNKRLKKKDMDKVQIACIQGFEDRYIITSDGRVFSIQSRKLLKPYKGKSNYYKVGLSKDGKTQYERIHRLVAKAFIPNEEDKPQVDHIDGDSTNNDVTNLQWVSPKENCNNPNTRDKRAHTFADPVTKKRMSQSHMIVEERKRLFRMGHSGFTSTGRIISNNNNKL